MTLQALKADLVPGEHARVGGAMRLMAGAATLKTYRSVLKSERTPLVSVALEAAGLVRTEGLDGSRSEGTVRIVAVHAVHCAGTKLVGKGALELSPGGDVAAGALFQLGAGFTLPVDRMARCTADLALSMSSLHASDVGWLVEMASQAGFIGSRGVHLCGLLDVLGCGRFGVLGTGAMTGFTSLALPSPVFLFFNDVVRILLECFEDVFVARLAGFRTRVACGLRGGLLHLSAP